MKTSITQATKAQRQIVARIMRAAMNNTATLAREVGTPAPKWSRGVREFVRRNA